MHSYTLHTCSHQMLIYAPLPTVWAVATKTSCHNFFVQYVCCVHCTSILWPPTKWCHLTPSSIPLFPAALVFIAITVMDPQQQQCGGLGVSGLYWTVHLLNQLKNQRLEESKLTDFVCTSSQINSLWLHLSVHGWSFCREIFHFHLHQIWLIPLN